MSAVAEDAGGARAPRVPARDARAENFSWEVDRAAMAARSERRAWRVAAISATVTVIAIAAVFVQGPLRRIETVALVVDKATGETTIANKLDIDTVPAADALDMHNADTFVRARESYNWSFLQRDYDMVKRMATPEVFTAYDKQFEPPNPLDKRLGSQGEQRIRIVGFRPPPTGRTGNRGEIVVTFDRELRLPNKPTPEITRFVSTIRFEYRPNLLAKQADRVANPFGFLVTAYRADEELAARSSADQGAKGGE